ncbi:Acetylxylan esterase 2 [Podospora australis]|uniref:Acetylxylan esterase 2 n=1 Tax=Podospora australis TaxID=1536484 RepID=A0AAN6WSE1_9PEZI|nr:Acetylxylan esterase 2 [Podospora australis]
MRIPSTSWILLSLLTAAASASKQSPPSCPALHIFGARETTAPQGFGTAQTFIDLVIQTFGSNVTSSEEIFYPAAGGREYPASVTTGIAAVIKQTATFAARCPKTVLVVHGYSQGAQIVDDAFCGGPDGESLKDSSGPLVTGLVRRNTAALILMGSPRFEVGREGNRGDATVGGFAARPKGFKCNALAGRILSFCDSPDPFCSNGTDDKTHQEYGLVYGKEALAFVISRVLI